MPKRAEGVHSSLFELGAKGFMAWLCYDGALALASGGQKRHHAAQDRQDSLQVLLGVKLLRFYSICYTLVMYWF